MLGKERQHVLFRGSIGQATKPDGRDVDFCFDLGALGQDTRRRHRPRRHIASLCRGRRHRRLGAVEDGRGDGLRVQKVHVAIALFVGPSKVPPLGLCLLYLLSLLCLRLGLRLLPLLDLSLLRQSCPVVVGREIRRRWHRWNRWRDRPSRSRPRWHEIRRRRRRLLRARRRRAPVARRHRHAAGTCNLRGRLALLRAPRSGVSGLLLFHLAFPGLHAS
mmetsp:Transcript_26691/g.43675  ORF Transcript_26691/g.43675 Transcript_26691/m.43675 type:complete len:218 (-) Transcript_26691:963-1616(-)